MTIAAWVYLVIFGSVVGYTAYVWLLAHAPLGTVSTYAYVNPVVVVHRADAPPTHPTEPVGEAT